MKILILGSTYLTEKCVEQLKIDGYELVGHIPSEKPTFPGTIYLPVVDESIPHDIKLSIQYDKKLTNIHNAYNLHTGLLPMYGGCDILYHTLKNKDAEQGLTLHKMGPRFDEGGIISKVTYPVQEGDTAPILYQRMLTIAPKFLSAALRLIETVDITTLPAIPPRLFKRGDIENMEVYKRDYEEIWNIVK